MNRGQQLTLQVILGDIYGGPVIGYEDGEFVLGYRYDASPSTERILGHPEWDEFFRMVVEWARLKNA